MTKKQKGLVIVFSFLALIVITTGALVYLRHQNSKERNLRKTAMVKEPTYIKKTTKVKKSVDPKVGRDNWMANLKKQENRKLKDQLKKEKQDSIDNARLLLKQSERKQFIIDSINKAALEKKRFSNLKKREKKKRTDTKKRTAKAPVNKVVAQEKEEDLFQIGIESTPVISNTKQASQDQNAAQPNVKTSGMRLCRIYYDQTIKHNGAIKLLTIDQVKLKNGVILPPSTMLFGYTRANENRMKAYITQAVSSKGSYDVKLIVFDNQDYQEGLSLGDYVEQGVNDASDDLAEQTLKNANLYGLDGIAKTVTKGLTKQKGRSLRLEDGDEVYVVEK